MSNWMWSIIIGLVVLAIVGYIIFARKNNKKYFSTWFFGFGRAITWVWKAIIGMPIPRYVTVVADRNYYYPPLHLVHLAIARLAQKKIEAGFVKENYMIDSWDCDNSALFDYHTLLNEILPELCKNIPEAQGKAVACGMFSFRRDEGNRHRVSYIIDETKKKTFIESYEVDGTIIAKLSPTEQSAGFNIT